MKIILFIIIFVLIQELLYAQTNFSTQFEMAYKNHSTNQLDSILMSWHKTSIPISSNRFQELSDTVKAVYEIFEKFYNPFELDSIKGFEFNNHFYDSIYYIIVSPSIQVQVVDRFLSFSDLMQMDSASYEKNQLCEFSINNFYPRLNFPNHKILFLTSGYDSVLTYYLKNEYSPMGTGNIMNPAQPIDESKSRVDFLSSRIKVVHGHWGGYWHLTTHPDISTIEFNRSLDTARVNFKLIYQWGEALFYKSNGTWNFIDSKITAIE